MDRLPLEVKIAKSKLAEFGVKVIGGQPLSLEGVPLFVTMRNEKYFLPHFLRHYRSIGITHFIVYADQCDNEFIGNLKSQKDVAVLTSERLKFGDVIFKSSSGSDVKFSQIIKEIVSNDLFYERWHLLVDADEFLLLPLPFDNINRYVDYLETQGQMYSYSPMVDFYPRRLRDRNHSTIMSPFEGSPYFDSGPYHRIHFFSRRKVRTHKGVRARMID